MEPQLEELEADGSEDALVAEVAAEKTASVRSFERKAPVRKPFPDLPRERVVVPSPVRAQPAAVSVCPKSGEDVTSTLEVIPRQWKVIETVREKFACRDCEKITQPPAPFHVVPRGLAGPSFPAMLLFDKYGQHQPLNRDTILIPAVIVRLCSCVIARPHPTNLTAVKNVQVIRSEASRCRRTIITRRPYAAHSCLELAVRRAVLIMVKMSCGNRSKDEQ